MKEWKDCLRDPPKISGFYKILSPSNNIHYARYLKPGPFMSGYGRDYRNGGHYPIIWPIKYIYLFGLNNKWKPDETVTEEEWINLYKDL